MKKIFLFSVALHSTLLTSAESTRSISPGLLLQFADGSKRYELETLKASKIIAETLEYGGDTIPLPQVKKQAFELLSIWTCLAQRGKSAEVKTRLKAATPKGLQELLTASNFLDIPQLTPLIAGEYFTRIGAKKCIEEFFQNPETFKEKYLSFAGNDSISLMKHEMIQLPHLVKLFPYFHFSQTKDSYPYIKDGVFPTFSADGVSFFTQNCGSINCFHIMSSKEESVTNGYESKFFSADKTTLAVGHVKEDQIKYFLYDTKTLQPYKIFLGLPSEQIVSIFGNKSKIITFDKSRKVIILRDLNNDLLKERYITEEIITISFNENNKTVALGFKNQAGDHFVTILNAADLKTKINPIPIKPILSSSHSVNTSSNGRFFSVRNYLYNVSTGNLLSMSDYWPENNPFSRNESFYFTRGWTGSSLFNTTHNKIQKLHNIEEAQWITNDILIGCIFSKKRVAFVDAEQETIVETQFRCNDFFVSDNGKTVAISGEKFLSFYDFLPFLKKEKIPAELLLGLLFASRLENVTDTRYLNQIKTSLTTQSAKIEDVELKKSLDNCITNILKNIPLKEEQQFPELVRSQTSNNSVNEHRRWRSGNDLGLETCYTWDLDDYTP